MNGAAARRAMISVVAHLRQGALRRRIATPTARGRARQRASTGRVIAAHATAADMTTSQREDLFLRHRTNANTASIVRKSVGACESISIDVRRISLSAGNITAPTIAATPS